MGTDIVVTETKYVMCYNLDIPLLHYIVLQPGQHLSTGQPEVELFPNQDEAIIRMIELGFNPDDYINDDEEIIE
jgi:hypothetical protein